MASASPSPSALEAARRHLRDTFLLESAERAVRALAPARQKVVRTYYDAGKRRAAVADDLIDSSSIVAALVIYRDAAVPLIIALATAFDAAATPEGLADPAAAWAAVPALARAGAIPPLPAAVEEARRLLTAPGLLAFDELPAETQRAQHATVKAALQWIAERVESRTLDELRTSRRFRVGFGVAGTLAVLLLVVTWASRGLTQQTNVALHKKVTVSQRNPGSTAPADNSGLVNGDVESTYGIHTAGPAPWVMVDLGAVYAVTDVVVHNRADGWFDEGLPLTLELSEDGAHFVAVDHRSSRFSADKPWIFQAWGQPARFVRISSNNYVALTEVEVHGTKK
jgi:hypothetical protein